MLKYIKLANLKIDMNSRKEDTKKLIMEFTHVFWATSLGPLLNLDPFFINDASFVCFCYIKISDPLTSEFCLQASFIR